MNADVPASNEQLWGVRPVRWGLRMLMPDPARLARCLTPAEVMEASDFLGVDLVVDGDASESVQRLNKTVAERQRQIESAIGLEPVLYANLRLLRGALGLNDVAMDLIAFRAMLRLHAGFEALAGKYIGLCPDFVFHRKLARLLGVSEVAVTAALGREEQLIRSGVVYVAEGLLGPLESRLRLESGLISALMTTAASPNELLGSILPPRRSAHLELSAYPHLAREIDLLRAHLGAALATHTPGTNVLLHGKPGTGKSELAAALAAELHSPLYASEPARDDGESWMPRDRLRNLVQLQKLARTTGNAIVLVDEAEDLFPTPWSDSEKVPTKAAINECLEQNPTPTIWISNRVTHMDEAFVRRFDLVIHVPPLPASRRHELLRELLPPHTLEDRELRRFAERRELSPAMITRMARVATAGDPAAAGANLRLLSGHYLRTLGADPMATEQPSTLAHDPGLLNTDPPLDDVLATLGDTQFGARMLLHGPPGTGKTALGKLLAERLDKPLLQRRASSLLSCYLGETEHNLRDMFDEARRESGVLLLDEADSFLRSRGDAHARWEVTQTNELLTQMEAFDGIFICTTNRLDDLDPASLRRFDCKVAFKPLRPEQRVHLIHDCCIALGLDEVPDEHTWRTRVERLDGLTPGDAAAALRRLRLTGRVPTLKELVAALTDDCRYKPSALRPIGFLQ